MTNVTCHTDGCPNAGIPLDVQLSWTDDDGETHETTDIVCGPCGNPITDIESREPT